MLIGKRTMLNTSIKLFIIVNEYINNVTKNIAKFVAAKAARILAPLIFRPKKIMIYSEIQIIRPGA
jgi:hypothetical protein